MSPDAAIVLRMRSERNKVGVPCDRAQVPPSLLAGLEECLSNGWLVWLDTLRHPAHPSVIDIYVATPAGLAALEPTP